MSRDEPQGRFVARPKGKVLSAKRFHLYRDCGLISQYGDLYEIIDLNAYPDCGGSIIDLFGLTLCSPCGNRASEVSAHDVIADVLMENLIRVEIEDGDSEAADDVATIIEEALASSGYKIRRERRGGASV